MVHLKQCRKFIGRIVVGQTLLAAFLLCVTWQFIYIFSKSDYSLKKPFVYRSTEVRKLLEAVSNKERNVPPLKFNPDFYFNPPYFPLLYGKPRKFKDFLTIGIPSVRRHNTDYIYLFDTLDSIIRNVGADFMNVTNVVLLISDLNKTYNIEISRKVYQKYSNHCDNGFLRVIQTSDCIYPNLLDIKRTFNDSQNRLQWRAKQNVDFAYLMLYSRGLSDYYIQIEDDVITAENFVEEIRNFIMHLTDKWYLLEFSRLGFIGKLFHSSDLELAAQSLLNQFDEAPGDLLLSGIRTANGQSKPIHANNSLFQHIGKYSSLENKMMPSLDNTFKDNDKIQWSKFRDFGKGDNPPAKIISSFVAYADFLPVYAYDNNESTFYWALTPKKDDHFTLTFDKPYNISRIIIQTGSVLTKKDLLLKSGLYVAINSSAFNAVGGDCGLEFIKLENLVDGDIDTKATGTAIPDNIVCLRILVLSQLKQWAYIRDIYVFLRKSFTSPLLGKD